jgi:hypothetical protein
MTIHDVFTCSNPYRGAGVASVGSLGHSATSKDARFRCARVA